MRLLLFNLATDADDPILGFTTGWICALAKQVEFVHVITMRVGRFDLPSNVRVYSVGKEKGYSEARRLVEFYRHLFRVLREDRIDACFSHMIQVFTVLAAPVLKLRGIPVVTWYAHPRVTWTLKLAHHLSTHMVASLSTAYPYRQDKLIVTGQGINTDLFSPGARVPSREPPTILCVGRLSPVKDHPTLLKAASILRRRLRDRFQVVIIGAPGSERDQPYIKSLRELVIKLDLREIVHFEPPASMERLPSRYRECAVHVNMTPTGFGDKVAWEAMACGKPCVVANEGFKDTLGKYAERLFFQHGDAEELADSLTWVWSLDRTDREQVGVYLREQVIKMHSLDRLATTLVGLFNEALRKNPLATLSG